MLSRDAHWAPLIAKAAHLCAVSDVRLTLLLTVSEFTSVSVVSGQVGTAPIHSIISAAHLRAVSDVRLTLLLTVSEFTSVSVVSGRAGSARKK